MMDYLFDIDDYPMHCCGMVEASDLSILEQGMSDQKTGKWRQATDQDYIDRLKVIERWQIVHRRNCCMLTLSSAQKAAQAAVESQGYTEIFKFFNPNSGRWVSIYTKVLWKNEDEYEAAKKNGTYIAPATRFWNNDKLKFDYKQLETDYNSIYVGSDVDDKEEEETNDEFESWEPVDGCNCSSCVAARERVNND